MAAARTIAGAPFTVSQAAVPVVITLVPDTFTGAGSSPRTCSELGTSRLARSNMW